MRLSGRKNETLQILKNMRRRNHRSPAGMSALRWLFLQESSHPEKTGLSERMSLGPAVTVEAGIDFLNARHGIAAGSVSFRKER